jgi:hypothetical protein
MFKRKSRIVANTQANTPQSSAKEDEIVSGVNRILPVFVILSEAKNLWFHSTP